MHKLCKLFVNFGGKSKLFVENMAEQNNQSGDLPRLVRTIVTDLLSENQPPNQESNNGDRFRNVNDEINNIFRIPRANTSQIPSSSQSSATTSRSNSSSSIAMNFNSLQNYSHHQPQRKRQGSRIPPTQQLRKRNRTQSAETNTKYLKNVFLLPGPTWTTVPRREKKVFLQTNNLVVDAFPIDKNWKFEELKLQFSQLFASIFQDDDVLESIG